MFPSDITTLLILQPGNLVYHLILMLSLALLYTTSRFFQAQRKKSMDQRWAQISLSLISLHALFIGIGVLAWLQILNGEVLLPGLERWVSFSSISLLLWGFLGAEGDRRERNALVILLILASLGAIATIIATSFLPLSFAFNATSYDAAWSLVSLALSLTGLFVFLMRRPSIWSLSFAGFALVAAGYGLHMGLGPIELSFGPYIRWGEIMGIPILALAALRSMLSLVEATETEPVQVPLSPAGAEVEHPIENDAAHLPQVLLDLQAFMTTTQLDRFSEMAVRTFGRAMKAELCILLTPPEESGQLSIATGYDLISERHLDGRTISTDEIPIIMQAMERKQSVDLPAQSQAPDLTGLQRSLFLDRTGAVLFSPILDGTDLLGGFVLLSPFARSRWPATSRRALEKLAELFVGRYRLIQSQIPPEAIPDRYYSPEVDATRREVERLVLENTRLTDQLIKATDQASHDLAGFLENHTLASETIQLLEDEISRMRTAITESEDKSPAGHVDELKTQLQGTLQELASARAKLIQIEGQPEHLEAQAPSRSAVKAISNLSQDLRQPMSTILGYSELLKRESSGVLTADQTQYVDHIHSSTDRLTRLLNSLINVMAIHTGTLDLVPTSIAIQVPLRDALAQVSTAIRNRRQTLRVDIPKSLPKVLGDSDAIFQMLVHLLNNAVGATPEAGRIWIAAKVAEADSHGFLTLWITDGGEGIPTNDIKRIFEVEYPRRGDRIRGVGDEGIGLSIAKSLVEAMGGRLWVDSQPQQGSTFTILLPLSEQPTSSPRS
jgi:signal transduction histidine kinase